MSAICLNIVLTLNILNKALWLLVLSAILNGILKCDDIIICSHA